MYLQNNTNTQKLAMLGNIPLCSSFSFRSLNKVIVTRSWMAMIVQKWLTLLIFYLPQQGEKLGGNLNGLLEQVPHDYLTTWRCGKRTLIVVVVQSGGQEVGEYHTVNLTNLVVILWYCQTLPCSVTDFHSLICFT